MSRYFYAFFKIKKLLYIFCPFDYYENMCDNGTTFCDESLRINVVHVDDIETTPAKLSPTMFTSSAKPSLSVTSVVTWYMIHITLRMLDDISWKEKCNISFLMLKVSVHKKSTFKLSVFKWNHSITMLCFFVALFSAQFNFHQHSWGKRPRDSIRGCQLHHSLWHWSGRCERWIIKKCTQFKVQH